MEGKVFVAERKEGGAVSQAIVTHCGNATGSNAAKGRISAVLRVSRADVREIERADIPRHLMNRPMVVTDGVTHSAWTAKPKPRKERHVTSDHAAA